MHFERRRRYTHGINLTPLIDVIFILIVYLMVTTSFVNINSMELSIPSEEEDTSREIAATQIRPQDVILIDIGAQNTYYLNSVIIGIDDLESSVHQLLKNDKDREVLIRASKDINVQQLVDIMDIVQIAGGNNISVNHWDEKTSLENTSPILPTEAHP